MTESNANDDVVDVVNEKKKTNGNTQLETADIGISESKIEVRLARNLWLRFREMLHKKYGYDKDLQDIDYETEFDQVFLVGLNHSLTASSSTTSILFDGKKPRRDVLINLAKIANSLSDCETTSLRRAEIVEILELILGKVDKRTEEKYRLCVEQNSIKDTVRGTFDVSSFIKLIPQDYLGRDEE